MKSFKGLLNKLSESNFDTLILKIEVFLHDTKEDTVILIDTLISFIKQDQNLIKNYYKILLIFNKDIQDTNILRIWNKFVNEKEWDIPDKYINSDIYDVNCNYDLFCDFKKWSKSILSYIYFWKIHNDNDKKKYISDILINSIMSYIDTNTIYKRHMIDHFLEELYVLEYDDNDKLNTIDIANIPTSTKFKIEKLLKNDF